MFGYEIVRLRLKGFTHFTSIGADDLVIDRRGSKNSIILVLGENGSGKSLLTSAWTPYPSESTNNRKRPLVVDGLKELEIITTDENGNHGDYLFRCRIIYSDTSTNCSIIQVDRITGEEIELNPSGLVRSYEAVIEELFGISKNYKNIGYLSSQVSSIVGMTPATRYEYMSSFLPNIEEYLEGYKIVFKRINNINRQVKMLENDIGDISLENVTRDKNLLIVKIDGIMKRVEELKTMKMRLSLIVENLADVSRDFIRKTIDTLSKNKRTLDSHHKRLFLLSSTSIEYLGKGGHDKLVTDVNACESRMSLINSKLSDISRSIDDKRLRLKDLEFNLGMLSDTGDSLPDIAIMIERIESSMVQSKHVMEKFVENYSFLDELKDSFTINEFNIISNLLSTIFDKYQRITDLVPLEKMNNLSEYSEINDKQVKQLLSKMREYDDRISKTLERISLLKNSPLDSSILDLTPDFCDSDRCGIVKEIKRLLSPDVEVDKLTNQLQSLYEGKSRASTEIDKINDDCSGISLAINFVSDIDHALMRDRNFITLLPSHIRDVLENNISNIFTNINSIMRDVEMIREFTSLRDQFRLYSTELKGLKEKESSLRVIRNMNSDIMNLNDSIDSLNAERIELHYEGELLLDKHKTLVELKDSINSISESIEDYNIATKDHIDKANIVKRLCKDWYYHEKITRVITSLDIDLKNLSVDVNYLNNELETLNNSIVTKKSLIDMRDRLLVTIAELNLLKGAWSPQNGIPSLFINNFLSRIHDKSNQYLEALNGGELKISKFEIGTSAREFPIIIMKNDGSIIPDASQCSDGQIALISLAISMAMISEAVKENGYNVIRLDEMDSVLDHERRKLYIEMIQTRLKEINSRQCLVITHSPEFDYVPADVILMPGAHTTVDSLSNKTVLLDLSNIEID